MGTHTMPKKNKCSLTVRMGNSMLCCGQRPSFPRIFSMLVLMSYPFTMAVPEVHEYRPVNNGILKPLFYGFESVTLPVSMDMVVVFPAPLWPRRAVM